MSIMVQMSASEALFALSAIQEAGARAHKARSLGGDASDIAETTASIYDGLERRIANLLYPRCDWIEECDMAVAGTFNDRAYCRFHLAQLEARQAASVPA